ncbi:MAG: Uncharacterised protein [Flavobacteriales bacterium UBA4585]|nr:MAG: Uncharacterised protein [Flavobacteriales bacterium UBA4585]
MHGEEVVAEEIETVIAAKKRVRLKMGRTRSLNQQILQKMAQKKIPTEETETTAVAIETTVINDAKEKTLKQLR